MPVQWQLVLINSEILKAKTAPLKGKGPIHDLMGDIIWAHMSMLEWHMQSRKFGMTAAQLELLQQKSVEVLESFVSTFPTNNVKANSERLEIQKGP
jgi:hypothetical protein